jgi:hypothetical protein
MNFNTQYQLNFNFSDKGGGFICKIRFLRMKVKHRELFIDRMWIHSSIPENHPFLNPAIQGEL